MMIIIWNESNAHIAGSPWNHSVIVAA